MFTRYGDLDGNSGVTAYELGPDFIKVRFIDGETYLYNSVRPGAAHVARMKALATRGRGLASYINKHIRKNHAGKL